MLTSFSCQKCFFTPSSLPPTSIPPPHPLSPPSPLSPPPPPSLHPSLILFSLYSSFSSPSHSSSFSILQSILQPHFPSSDFPTTFFSFSAVTPLPSCRLSSLFSCLFFSCFFFFLDASGSVSTTRLSPWRKENTNNGTAAEFRKENEKVAHRDVEGFH